MKLLKVKIITDGGPWAEHNYPCTVCRKKPAVLHLDNGIMQPCWGCQKLGFWVVGWRPNWWYKIIKAKRFIKPKNKLGKE